LTGYRGSSQIAGIVRARCTRRALVAALALAAPAAPVARAQGEGDAGGSRAVEQLQLVEADVAQLQQALADKRISSEQLVQRYLARIAAYDAAGPALRAVLQVNTNAVAQARASDERRRTLGPHGPLEGIPVLVKDNIDTADLPTTAGSVALRGSLPPDDAFLVRRLREAGAIVLGKATLTEFANFLTEGMPSGYSSLGGFGRNPYDPRPLPGGDGRSVLDTGGSSSGSGIGVSANLAALAVGTETSGSILSPASSNGVVGIKPTVGLISRDGVVPITAEQDTPGPIARTVADAARLLGVLAGFDPADPATAVCLEPGNCAPDYTAFLDAGALAGARIVVPPFPDDRAPIMDAAIAVLRERGARVEAIPALARQRGICAAAPPRPDCSTVLLFGFRRDLDGYLAATPGAPVRSLAEVIEVNRATPGALMYGQTLALAAQALDPTPGSPDAQRAAADRAEDLRRARGALDAVYAGADGMRGTSDDVDAVLFSENFGADIAARAGYPSIVVPGGFLPPRRQIANPFPSGVTFSGPPFSEPRLIALAHAFEQATRHRRPPDSAPPLPEDLLGR
jgi:amidase